MNDHNKNIMSAQVILKPEGGKDSIPPENVTSENVHLIMPSAQDFEQAQSYFAELGFEVDAEFANSFSITGNAKLFEKTFNAKFSTDEKKAVKATGEEKKESSELPLGKLSGDVKKIIETVTFSQPPDFGPENF